MDKYGLIGHPLGHSMSPLIHENLFKLSGMEGTYELIDIAPENLSTDVETWLKNISDFIPEINNWAVCDSFCSTLKFTAKNKERVWDFIQPYAHSQKEFEQRFCAVMLLDYFINAEYIDRTLALLTQIDTSQYYSSMAVAWALAECFIKFREKTEPFINKNSFDEMTLKRTIRKICDSYRVDEDVKLRVKSGELRVEQS